MRIRNKKENIEINSEVDFSVGLNQEEVSKRKSLGLVNKISKNVTKPIWKIFTDNIFNFFNILIFLISIFMIVADNVHPIEGSRVTFTMFASAYILLINICIGIYQDVKARRQIDKLKVVTDPVATVLRDGVEQVIPANELVIDDISILKNGDQIIADAVVVEGYLEVNESSLTGESISIKKCIGDPIYSGSFVVGGNAKVKVTAVGKANYIEKLQSKAKKFSRPKSEILKTLKFLFKVIGFVVIILGTVTLVTNAIKGIFWEQALNFSGSMIAMIPSGLYLLVSMTLAVGVIRLAKHRTLVKELYSIETLARVDVLCLDKTGTLTDGSLRVKELRVLNDANQDEIERILFTLVKGTCDTNRTAQAIEEAYSSELIFPIHSAVPFNSERKYSAVMLKDGRSFVLGAREFIPHKDKKVDLLCETYEKEGYRVLVLGMSKKVINPEKSLENMDIFTVLVLKDHIKDDAKENIEWFKNNGVSIKIISGDNPITVSRIAEQVGVENADTYISLEGMSLDEVREIANQYTVFGRVSPEQKEVIVRSLQEQKHVVGMTGDGVNDVLALKAADCSIAMASGSDAAKAVAHLVTMDSNFSSLPTVVAEGRRVINNLQRTCTVFLCKTIFAMILTTVFFISSWAGGMAYPFVTNNLYIWELVTIGASSFFLSLQPNTEKIQNGFLTNILTKSIPGGLIQAGVAISIFSIHLANPTFLPMNSAITMAVFALSFISLITVIIISIPFDIYRGVLAIVLTIIIPIMFIIDHFGTNGEMFRIDYLALDGEHWLVLLGLLGIAVGLYFLIDFIAKIILKNISLKRRA